MNKNQEKEEVFLAYKLLLSILPEEEKDKLLEEIEEETKKDDCEEELKEFLSEMQKQRKEGYL